MFTYVTKKIPILVFLVFRAEQGERRRLLWLARLDSKVKAAVLSILQLKPPKYSMSQTFTKGKKNKTTTPLGNKSCINKCVINYALFMNN